MDGRAYAQEALKFSRIKSPRRAVKSVKNGQNNPKRHQKANYEKWGYIPTSGIFMWYIPGDTKNSDIPV